MVAEQPRVCYLIFAGHPKSGGGHFHSLRTTVECISERLRTKTINLGIKEVKLIAGLPEFEYIPVFRKTMIDDLRGLFRTVKQWRPDVLHAFDFKSLWVARLLGAYLRLPVVYTKCGGRNGSNFIPNADAVVLFSGENYEHFERYGKLQGRLHLIPNRVNGPVIQDLRRIQQLREKYDLWGKQVVLRIGRVHPYYRRTYEQTLNLLSELRDERNNMVVLFIGFVQDKSLYQELLKLTRDLPVVFVTEQQFTDKAAELIDVADVCVTTGRGTMEAASLGKATYCPQSNGTSPIPLSHGTLPALLHYNFSERTVMEGPSPVLTVEEMQRQAREIFAKYFDLSHALPVYTSIYRAVQTTPAKPINFLLHSLRFLKSLR